MRLITLEMINLYKIKEFDFMGYIFEKPNELSFHHLIIPRRLGGEESVSNGAILKQSTAHDYLHRIEAIDHDMFLAITSEMIDENIKGKIDIENLKNIREVLLSFEKHYSSAVTKKGQPLIKEEYISNRIKIG